jgi:hypothetical protein
MPCGFGHIGALPTACAGVLKSADGGATWTSHGEISLPSTWLIEPSIEVGSKGQLLIFFRTAAGRGGGHSCTLDEPVHVLTTCLLLPCSRESILAAQPSWVLDGVAGGHSCTEIDHGKGAVQLLVRAACVAGELRLTAEQQQQPDAVCCCGGHALKVLKRAPRVRYG